MTNPRPDRLLLLAAIAMQFGCSQSPIVENSRSVPSPSGAKLLTVETVDNGLGFGLGRLYEEVHVTFGSRSIHGHGESDVSVAFYVDVTEARGESVDVRWIDDKSIEISYDRSQAPGRMANSVAGVSVAYKVRG